jgi:hypothetical protein
MMQNLYSCLWLFCVERLWYTCPYYICFFKSSGLWLLLLEPTLSLVRVLPLDSRLSSVRISDCSSNEDTSDVLDWLMYHECLSTSLLSLRIAARIMQERCRMQILYSCLWTFFVERLWYTYQYYICFFKSSDLFLLLLEPTLSLVRVAAADLVLNLDSDIRLGEGCWTSSSLFDLISWISCTYWKHNSFKKSPFILL